MTFSECVNMSNIMFAEFLWPTGTLFTDASCTQFVNPSAYCRSRNTSHFRNQFLMHMSIMVHRLYSRLNWGLPFAIGVVQSGRVAHCCFGGSRGSLKKSHDLCS